MDVKGKKDVPDLSQLFPYFFNNNRAVISSMLLSNTSLGHNSGICGCYCEVLSDRYANEKMTGVNFMLIFIFHNKLLKEGDT